MLQSLVNPKLKIPFNLNGHLELKEEQSGTDYLSEVILSGFSELSENKFAFSLDREGFYNSFIDKSREKVNKNCDGVLFLYKTQDNVVFIKVFLMELKSKKPKPIQYEPQLINGALFTNYLRELYLNHFSNENKNIKIEYFYILFYLDQGKRPIIKKPGIREKYKYISFESMQNYKEQILKYPMGKTAKNYITIQDIISHYK
ncbi:MAG: hypothetical protein KDK90_18935 [Leptospiraceae bacterium]|nr:hypothetical protein [Leptospiraceae bacterium]